MLLTAGSKVIWILAVNKIRNDNFKNPKPIKLLTERTLQARSPITTIFNNID